MIKIDKLQIKKLQIGFTISIAALKYAETVRAVLNDEQPKVSKMEMLHQRALDELEKQSPDNSVIAEIMDEIQKLSTQKQFPSGGNTNTPHVSNMEYLINPN